MSLSGFSRVSRARKRALDNPSMPHYLTPLSNHLTLTKRRIDYDTENPNHLPRLLHQGYWQR